MNIPLEIYDITQRFATRIGFLPTNQEIKKLDNIKFESPETKRKFLVIGKEVTITEGVESRIQTSNIKSKKIIHRLVDVWGVRGHYRHYKSGKNVWINPYRKGIRRNDKEPVPKTYIIDSKDKKDIFDKDPIDNLF